MFPQGRSSGKYFKFITVIIVVRLSQIWGKSDGWGKWSNYTECSRTCGGGVQQRVRYCLIRRPAIFECRGPNVQHQLCNVQECPPGSIDFRSYQCNYDAVQSIDTTNILIWRSYFDPDFPCRLICKNENGQIKKLNQTVIDGSRCNSEGRFGICINGICKVKFENYSPLMKVEKSITKSRVFKRSTKLHYSWVFGSWTSCSEKCGTGYQLRAVSCIDNDTGNIVRPQLCPQNEMPVRNQTCSAGSCQTSLMEEFKWIGGNWKDCNVDCGLGEQTQIMHCVQTSVTGNSSYTSDDACLHHVGMKPDFVRICYGDSDYCPYWASGSWSECSVTCGFGIQTRHIYCQRDPADTVADPIVLDDLLCPNENKPQHMQTCALDQCSDGSYNNIQSFEVSKSVTDCRTSKFGCCPDKRTPAKGSAYFGCSGEMNVGVSNPCELPRSSGPCEDYVIKWYFDTKEQDCLRFWYGGCQGNENRFDDSNSCRSHCQKKSHKFVEKVISCSESKYGCCEDGLTSARGPNSFGCSELNKVGTCAETRYGCCADGFTVATGPNKEGCHMVHVVGGCAGTRYGCCDDGITAALGNNKHGCAENQIQSCTTSLYGCCPDRITAASGPNYSGCLESSAQSLTGCTHSTHGCCSDSVSFAHGQNGEGCPHIEHVSCEQPKNAGTCINFTAQWHFETSSKTCRQFWYGGCGGNSNRFSSKEECEAKCINSKEPVPHTRPMKAQFGCAESQHGCCPDQQTSAKGPHYKGCQKKCENSTYGCCADGVTPAEGQNQEGCDFGSGDIPCKETEFGCCADGITLASGPLKTGCGDTLDSEEKIKSSQSHMKPTNVAEKCTAPVSVDLCTEYSPKWRFDNQKNECVRYWWGGCKDNGNAFESQGNCEVECINAQKTVTKVTERCTAVVSRELCTEYSVKWRFDNQNHECVRHWWGGCKDNGNVFESQGDCEAECMNNLVIMNPGTGDSDIMSYCDIPKDAGPCTDNLLRHYYDPKDRICRAFYYGGCQGNDNNFMTIEECQRKCEGFDLRPGIAATTLKFPSVTTTESPQSKESADVCSKPMDVGPCRAAIPRFFFESKTGSCKNFLYGGCQGNLNNFATLEACNKKCFHYRHGSAHSIVGITGGDEDLDICQLNPEKGNCRGYNIKWYFNAARNQCARFVYTGCDGNGNQFNNEKECTDRCLTKGGDSGINRQASTIRPVQTTILPFVHPKDDIYSKVTVQPEISVDHKVIISRPGIDTYLWCSLRGHDALWYHDGVLLSSSQKFQIYHNGTLILKDITEDMSGLYTCRISSGSHILQLEKFKVEVYETIGVNIQSHHGIFFESDTIHLICKATGYPAPHLEWMKDGIILKSDRKVSVRDGDLTIKAASIEDSGIYKCIASNNKDKAEDVTTVQIKYPIPLTKCEDTMRRAKCKLIVAGRLCGIRIFSNICCQSCRMAKLL